MAKLIITPEILALQAERSTRESPPQKSEELPALVKRFWEASEASIPLWRHIESAEEREQREEAQSRGCWTG